jgi:serine/threonine protein kinase
MILTFLVPEGLSPLARERFLTRFLQESARLTKLRHPNIVPLYNFGEYEGSPYLVLPFAKGHSLANLLKEQPRFTPEQTAGILTQVAAGLDYVHSYGIVHGSLNPATILLDEQHIVQIARLGLVHLLETQSIEQSSHPFADRFSTAGTFLGSSAYIAPEWSAARSVDPRVDIYALGATVFELLSGKPPFIGIDSLTGSKNRLQLIPSLHTVNPDLPPALDSVVRRALEHDPTQRFQSAGEMARAFEWAMKATQEAIPFTTTVPFASRELPARPRRSVQPRPSVKDRRRLVTTLAVGGVVALGAFGVAAMNLSHLAQQMTQAQINRERAPTPASLTQGNIHTPHPTHSTNKGTQPTPTTNHAPTAPSRLDPTPTPKVQPTSQPPSPTPTPAHTGVVIGYSSQPINSANEFINPADGSASTLIHLPNNNFAAYEKACTHQGVPVHYNPATHKLVCPKHDAIFDPANAGRVLQGPARRPLPSVAIRVNGDGTITTG